MCSRWLVEQPKILMIFLKLILLGIIIYVSSDQQASSEVNSNNPSNLDRVITKESLSLISLAETSIQESRHQLGF